MQFDLMESDQTGVFHSKTVSFPEITIEMYENDEYREVLNEWLKREDLNSFSTSFFFQKAQEEELKTGATAIIVMQIGLIDSIYVCEDPEEAEAQVVGLANQYFRNYIDGKLVTFKTFEEVDEFQFKYDTDSVEIKIVKVSELPK